MPPSLVEFQVVQTSRPRQRRPYRIDSRPTIRRLLQTPSDYERFKSGCLNRIAVSTASVPPASPADRPPKVTIGQDGKNYPASSPTPPESSDSEPITTTIAEPVEPDVVAPPRTPKRRSIVDTAVDLGHDLRKVSDRVVEITADDRLDTNRDGVGGQLRHYLGQIIESCRELGHRIDPPTEPTPAPQPTPQPEPTPAQARSQLDARSPTWPSRSGARCGAWPPPRGAFITTTPRRRRRTTRTS